jgi:hypothetical protein
MEQTLMPPELLAALNGEHKDFAVKATRAVSRATANTLIGMAVFWNGFISIFWIAFFGPLLQGKEVHLTVNGVKEVASMSHLSPLIIPAIIIGIFTMIGVAILVGGIKALNEPGPWFVGTESRLIIFTKGSVQSVDWENFTGVTHTRGTNEMGEIMFELRTGRMVSQGKHGGSRYVPNQINMVGVSNPFGLEQMCRKRIKENDPTPPNTGARAA